MTMIKKLNHKIHNKIQRIDKYNLISCSLLIISFLIFICIVTRFKYYPSSLIDWESQHVPLADYFRTLFYANHDPLPNFAANIGNGQNIYNFSYYGFLSPIILISYLLPFIKMIDYIVISSIICAISSSILFYYFLRKNNHTYLTSFLSSFALLFATSLTFHTQRHIMFVNYMPFLILGLYGVDKKLVNKKGWLLSISVFLMIMTSYYYSVSGIIVLIIYGVYKYIQITPKITFKKFLLSGLSFASPFIIAVLSSAIITLPTFYVILNSRGVTYNTITWQDLIIPDFNFRYILYDTYGIGLTAIAIFAILNLLSKKREKLFLGISLSVIIILPIINYILNATMYIDAKVLIPFLPLAALAISDLLSDTFQNKINLRNLLIPIPLLILLAFANSRYFYTLLGDLAITILCLITYKKYRYSFIMIIPLIAIPFTSSVTMSLQDDKVEIKEKQQTSETISNAINYITESDQSYYRISNALSTLRDVNNIYNNPRYNTSSLYSSTYNLDYNNFYYDTINNPIQNRNRVITATSPNIISLLYFNNEYLIRRGPSLHGYELINIIDGLKIYHSNDTLPVFYATSNILSEDDFDNLSYPYNAEALLKNVIVGTKSNNDFVSNIKSTEINWDNLEYQNLDVTKEKDYYHIKTDKTTNITYKLPEYLHEKIIFVRFNVIESQKCDIGDFTITINETINKLTCQEWKYHNQNYQFDYVISDSNLTELNIEFSKGEFKLNNFEMYYLDYAYIKNINSQVTPLEVDQELTKGDEIVGEIDVENDGYFVTTIPFDIGFEIKLDGENIPPERVNKAFLGFPITKGKHHIHITYKSPLKEPALIISSIGLISFALVTFIESKRRFIR